MFTINKIRVFDAYFKLLWFLITCKVSLYERKTS